MMNLIWWGLLLCGVGVAIWTGRVEEVSRAALEATRLSVELGIGLLGVAGFWLGLMKVAAESGLLQHLVRFIRPLLRWLFPEVPPGHPAEEAIALNLGANFLGLGNAATPFGLEAMRRLQELNRGSSKASPAMCTLLALNTSSVTVFPVLVLSVRAAAGAANPTDIIAPILGATLTSTVAAIALDRYFRRREGRAGRSR